MRSPTRPMCGIALCASTRTWPSPSSPATPVAPPASPPGTSRSPRTCCPNCTPESGFDLEGNLMPVARVNDIELNYKLEGDGDETIVLINGLADDLETWAGQMDDLLAAGYRVLRFDNRGIGASSKPAGPYSSRMLADDAKALADSLGITGFHLMGVSMGGMIAQEYALAYPVTCSRSPSPAPTRPPGPSAPGCSPCGPTWRPCWASPSSCGTSPCGRSRCRSSRPGRPSSRSSSPRFATWTSRSTPTSPAPSAPRSPSPSA